MRRALMVSLVSLVVSHCGDPRSVPEGPPGGGTSRSSSSGGAGDASSSTQGTGSSSTTVPQPCLIEFADNGVVIGTIRYTYDARHNLIRTEQDSNNDGTPESVITRTYDANDRLTEMLDTINGQRTRRSYTYDGQARLALVETDVGDDGTIDARTTYRYEPGRRTIQEDDSDADGDLDVRIVTTTDGDDEPLVEESDYDADGTLDRRTTWTYAGPGKVERVEVDEGADGTINLVTRYTYNAQGRLERVDFDNNNDGMVDQRMLYAYDAQGRFSRFDIDWDGDGSIDRSNVYSYDCP